MDCFWRGCSLIDFLGCQRTVSLWCNPPARDVPATPGPILVDTIGDRTYRSLEYANTSQVLVKAAGKFLSLAPLCALALASAPAANAAGLTVLTVPWDAANLASPHTTYPLPFGAPTSATPTSEVSVVLGATVPSAVGSTDSFTYSWTFGDGTSKAAAAVTNPYDISATHQYPYTDPVGTQYTATVTVTDTTTGATGSGTYLITQQANSLQTRVNVAIDKGLWYLHQAMYHVDNNNTNTHTGTWESCSSFPPVSGNGYACSGSGSLTATNVQAFEVDGHFANGPATDPYTNDVSEGLASIWQHLTALPTTTAKTYTYNPAVTNFGCLNGTAPEPSGGACSDGSHVLYNSAASSCTTPPCTFTFDGNSNGQMVYSSQQYYFGYEQGMYIDALVASGTPNATAPSTAPTGIANETYQNIVQDIVDFSAFSQYRTTPTTFWTAVITVANTIPRAAAGGIRLTAHLPATMATITPSRNGIRSA